MSELRFDDQVAIVTGAGRGLGRAHALFLAARGARVVVNDLGTQVDGTGKDEGPAQDVVDEIRANGGTALGDAEDVSSELGADMLVDRAVQAFGRLDIVINNAGILELSDFPAADLIQLKRHLAVHLEGTFNVSRAAWPHMRRQRFGRIVNTTSTAILGSADLLAYGSAKGGVVGLSRSLAESGRSRGIAVNLVSPMASTRMSDPALQPEDRHDELRRERPPQLVSAVVLFLAHPSCPVTGEIYVAGRGRVARLFLAQTVGYTNLHLTPENVRDHWADIQDESGFSVPLGTISHGIEFDVAIDETLGS